ncbi:MAG: amidohydrolase family protein [Asticcacaulis sp.]
MSLYSCRHHGLADVLAHNPQATRNPARTIDMHCHCFTPAVEALVADTPQKKAEPDIMLRNMGAASVEHNRTVMLPEAGPKLMDVATRLKDMDTLGIDIQLISPGPPQYYYWADADLAQDIVTLQNDHVASLCVTNPDRFVGLGTVALQHPELAVSQLRHLIKNLGLKGIQVSTSVGALELADPKFHPVWQACEELGALVFIHPLGSSMGERIAPHYLSNIIGQPIETAVALSHLIFGGVLDSYPALKILAAHGGGYLPTYIGRSDHGWDVRPEACTCQHPPSTYLKRIWFDSLVYDPKGLAALIDQVGLSQVVLGTDYPFDMGAYDVHELIRDLPNLTEEAQATLLGGNAAQLLGLN